MNSDHAIYIQPVGTSDTYNTWYNWRLIPAHAPTIAPPQVESHLVYVPGRAAPIDLSGYLLGSPDFKSRVGSWEFYMEQSFSARTNVHERIELMRDTIHGKECYVQLADDPYRKYTGILKIEDFTIDDHWCSVTIGYELYPEYVLV